MNVADGSQLWGDQYNRPASDLLAVQDEIASEILDKIRPRLSGAERKKRAPSATPTTPTAYQLYLQGRYHWNKGTIAGYKNAIEYFQQAIGKDPKYALAYAGLADSYLLLGSYWVEAITEAKARGRAGAASSIRTWPRRTSRSATSSCWLDWDWPAAEREFTQGISLNPSSALAHNQYAMYLATLGRVPDADRRGPARAGTRSALAHRQQRSRLVPALRRADGRRDRAVPQDARVRRQLGVRASRPRHRAQRGRPARRGDRRS